MPELQRNKEMTNTVWPQITVGLAGDSILVAVPLQPAHQGSTPFTFTCSAHGFLCKPRVFKVSQNTEIGGARVA